MSCSLTTGYALGCNRDSVGGIKTLYVQGFNSTGSVNTNGSGTVTGFTGYIASGFYKYDLTRATSMMSESLTASTENGTLFYAPEITFVINKLQVAVRNELRLMAKGRLIAIVEDNNGRYWLLGAENGLEITTGTSSTGTAFGDRNGFEMTLTGMEPAPLLSIALGIFSASSTQISGS